MIPEKYFFIRASSGLSIKEIAGLIGIRSDQFVVDTTEWSYQHLIKESEGIWSDYRDQVHGNGWQVISSAQYERRRWEVIDGWVIRFSASARVEDIAQAKVWLEQGPKNRLGVIDSQKTKGHKDLVNEVLIERRKKSSEEFEKKVTSLELWKYVCAAGAAHELTFGWPTSQSTPEEFLVAFQKGEELWEENPVKFYEGKKFHLCLQQIFRWTGQTGRHHSWVIAPSGEKRIPDNREFGNNGRSDYDGVETWNYILPDELVLVWEKEFTASPHIFKVMHKPASVTPEQKQKALEFEQFAEEEFKSAVGISGKRSPGIGDGFGI